MTIPFDLDSDKAEILNAPKTLMCNREKYFLSSEQSREKGKMSIDCKVNLSLILNGSDRNPC